MTSPNHPRANERVRSCVGCGARVPRLEAQRALVRLVVGPDGAAEQVVVDLAGRAFGRGSWVHPRRECLARACKRLHLPDAAALAEAIAREAERRAEAWIGLAARTRRALIGHDAIQEARQAPAAVIVARDAAAVARGPVVAQALAEGRAIMWGTKAELGAACGRELVGAVAILDSHLAEAIVHALGLSASLSATPAPQRGAKDSRG